MKINYVAEVPPRQLMNHQPKWWEGLLGQHATVESNPLKLEFVKSIKLQCWLQESARKGKKARSKKYIDKRQTSKYNQKKGEIQMIAHKKWHFSAHTLRPDGRGRKFAAILSAFIASVTVVLSFRIRLDWKFVTIKEDTHRWAISNHSKCCRDNARHGEFIAKWLSYCL